MATATTVALLVGVMLGARDASAHQDPPACSGADIAQSLIISKPSGVAECEPLTSSTTLTWVDRCLISGGNLVIGVADPGDLNNPAADQILDSVPVPCLGNATVTAEGCAPGQGDSVSLTDVVVTPRPQDIAAGFVVIRARWAGVLHQSAANQPQTNTREVVVPIVACPDNQFCADVECEYDAQTDTATCPVTDISATQCPDDLFCADVVCNEDIDQCVTTNTSATQCPDNLFCADVTCDESEDRCVTTDVSAQQCSDGGVECIDAACDEDLDQCEIMVDDQACDDANACTVDRCDPETGCAHDEIAGCVPCVTAEDCDDGDPCTTDFCEDDVCKTTPIEGCVACVTAEDCDDADGCTADVCVDDVCVWTPVSGCLPCVVEGDCDDANPCTLDTCVENACMFTPIEGCRPCVTAEDCADGDACTVEICVDDVCVSRPSFLAKVRAQFGNFSEIDGNLGVNDQGGQLRLGRSVFMFDGSVASGDLVRIGNDSSVYAVYANELVTGQGVLVRGPTGAPVLPITDPFCPVPEFTCGTSRVTVDAGATSSPLAPGSYGSVRVFNGGTLRLAPGTFHFCEIRTGRRTNILTSGPTTINVVGKVRLSNGSSLGPASGSPTPTMNVLGSQVRVGAGSFLQANLSAPGALLTMGRGAHLVGTFCVYRTRTDKRVIIECPPDGTPSSPSGSFLE